MTFLFCFISFSFLLSYFSCQPFFLSLFFILLLFPPPSSFVRLNSFFFFFLTRLSHGCVMDSWTRHFLFSCVWFAYIYVHKLGMLLRCLLRNYHLNFFFSFLFFLCLFFLFICLAYRQQKWIFINHWFFFFCLTSPPLFRPHIYSFLIPHTSGTLYLFHSLFCSFSPSSNYYIDLPLLHCWWVVGRKCRGKTDYTIAI